MRSVLGAGRRVSESVEELHLLLAVAPDRMVGRQLGDQLAYARPELVREVRRGRPDEGVDVVARRLGHGGHPNDGAIGANL